MKNQRKNRLKSNVAKIPLCFVATIIMFGCGSNSNLSQDDLAGDDSYLYLDKDGYYSINSGDFTEIRDQESIQGYEADAKSAIKPNSGEKNTNQNAAQQDPRGSSNTSTSVETFSSLAQKTYPNQIVTGTGRLAIPGFYDAANLSLVELDNLKQEANQRVPDMDSDSIPSITFDFNPSLEEASYLKLFCMTYEIRLTSEADTLQQAFLSLDLPHLDREALQNLQMQRDNQWQDLSLDQPRALLHFANRADSVQLSETVCFRGQLKQGANLTGNNASDRYFNLSETPEDLVAHIKVLETTPAKVNVNVPKCSVVTNQVSPGSKVKVNWPDSKVGETVYRILLKSSQGETQTAQFLSTDPTGLEINIPAQFPENQLFVDILRIPFDDDLGVAFCQLELELKAPGPADECFMIDFDKDRNQNAILPGVDLSERYLDMGVRFKVINNNPKHPNALITFDSTNPTGEDIDLKTPGKGKGNNKAQNNLAIIAENLIDQNQDGRVDNPDDEHAGGKISVILEQGGLYVHSIRLFDLEESGVKVKLYSVDMTKIKIHAPKLGNNSAHTLNLEPQLESEKLDIHFPRSGAIDDIKICNYPSKLL